MIAANDDLMFVWQLCEPFQEFGNLCFAAAIGEITTVNYHITGWDGSMVVDVVRVTDVDDGHC